MEKNKDVLQHSLPPPKSASEPSDDDYADMPPLVDIENPTFHQYEMSIRGPIPVVGEYQLKGGSPICVIIMRRVIPVTARL